MYTTFEEEAKRKLVRGRSLSILEYDKILDRLVNHARTIYGRELCYGLVPTSDLPLVKEWQKETEDALEFLVKEGSLPLGGVNDIRDAVRFSDTGTTLSMKQLLFIAQFLRAVERLSQVKVDWLRVEPQDHYLFREIRQLMPLQSLEKEISMSINGENEMNDRASNELYNIRRQIRDAQSSIREILGTVEFYKAMTEEGIHPIIGCEVYVAPRGRFLKENEDRGYYHLVLLAKNDEGLKNLNRLVSAGFTEGFYYKPRVDHELLEKYSEGLIALSACVSGEVATYILKDDPEKAKNAALWYDRVFGRGNYYLEIQSNQLPEQAKVNQHLIMLSNETGIPLVATNDCHYMYKEDAKAHEVLLCMQTGKRMSDPDRMKMTTEDYYIKSEEEMRSYFSSIPSAIENTTKIASMCHAGYTFDQIHLPVLSRL